MTPLRHRVSLAWAGLPFLGERVSGDVVLVHPDGPPRACVVDVAGHGRAARAVAEQLEEEDPLAFGGRGLPEVLRALHRRLLGVGAIAAAMAVRVSEQEGGAALEYCGVGNVRIAFSSDAPGDEGRPGMLGGNLPALRVQRQPLRPGDLVAVYTDGVSGELSLGSGLGGLRLQDVAALLLRRHGRRYDDATCLVLRLEEP